MLLQDVWLGGCAALYLAQMAGEANREALLTQTIDRHTDAWYGDGTPVGPMARAGRTLPNRAYVTRAYSLCHW